MVIKKDQLRTKKLEPVDTFEKFFFVILGLLSLLLLVIIFWILLSGDDVIFLHGVISRQDISTFSSLLRASSSGGL